MICEKCGSDMISRKNIWHCIECGWLYRPKRILKPIPSVKERFIEEKHKSAKKYYNIHRDEMTVREKFIEARLKEFEGMTKPLSKLTKREIAKEKLRKRAEMLEKAKAFARYQKEKELQE